MGEGYMEGGRGRTGRGGGIFASPLIKREEAGRGTGTEELYYFTTIVPLLPIKGTGTEEEEEEEGRRRDVDAKSLMQPPSYRALLLYYYSSVTSVKVADAAAFLQSFID